MAYLIVEQNVLLLFAYQELGLKEIKYHLRIDDYISLEMFETNGLLMLGLEQIIDFGGVLGGIG